MKKIFLLLLSFVLAFSATAQNEQNSSKQQEESDNAPFKHLGIGLRVSTLGAGLEVSTNLNKNFKLRGGLSILPYSKDFTFNMDDSKLYEALGGYNPDYKMEGKLNFTNGHLLVDIHPMRYGIFHFTAGLFIGKNKIDASGYLQNSVTGKRITSEDLAPGYAWPKLEIEGHQVVIDNGAIDATFELGQTLKPYFGIGIGRSLPKSRLGFMFELGAIYQGDYKIKQAGQEVNITQQVHDSFQDIGDYTKYLKWWPMLNFQLTYRIF